MQPILAHSFHGYILRPPKDVYTQCQKGDNPGRLQNLPQPQSEVFRPFSPFLQFHRHHAISGQEHEYDDAEMSDMVGNETGKGILFNQMQVVGTPMGANQANRTNALQGNRRRETYKIPPPTAPN